ncbi:MAG: polysaccharide deacetylase family protein [Hyphomicrobiaceae bacterium]
MADGPARYVSTRHMTSGGGAGYRRGWLTMGAVVLLAMAMTLCWGAADRALALQVEFSGRAIKFDILALYDKRSERAVRLTRIHQYAEMPLNYLGFRVTYRDVNEPLPSDDELSRYRGVLTWFAEPLSKPLQVLEWIDRAQLRGLRYVALGAVAPPEDERTLPLINQVLARLGLEHRAEEVSMPWRARVAEMDGEMMGFERPIDRALPPFFVMGTKGGSAEAHLVLEAPSGDHVVRSTLVATSPAGGFADGNFAIYFEPNTDRSQWTLNPFAFFGRAFGNERRPIPDTTTLMGRRIYFSHIDGDGWNNVSDIEHYKETQTFSSEVIEREAIVPYPDLPVSVGLLVGDTIPALGGTKAAGDIARRIFALPQVEVATHTYSHPFNWQFFEHYDRAAEMRLIDSHGMPEPSLKDRFSRAVMNLAGRQMKSNQSDKYIAGSDALPRAYMHRPFDLDSEIAGALKGAERFAPPGKRARLYLWSGDTTPFPAAIRAVRLAGAYNMNGGDSRFDPEYPSVAYVPPISRVTGGERQIYAGNSNENTYTNDWTGPYYGQFMLVNTLANTESPRRLKPFNLYYHMYSGERPGSLAAVKHILALARKARVIPIAASGYAAIANDFFNVEIVQIDMFSWSINHKGKLGTVRFDDASQLAVDIPRSRGVLGSVRKGDVLYVSLDSAVEPSIVTLRGRAAEQAARAEGTAWDMSLVDSRWRLWGLHREDCGLTVSAQGFGKGDMLWQTSPRRGYRITATRKDKVILEQTLWADDGGNLAVHLPSDGMEPLKIRLACHD